MKRLTEEHWRNLDPWECCGQDRFCGRGCNDLGGCTNGCIVPKLYARLAAYEDIMPLDLAQEFAQAEKDGRLVVLPCKVGDTVFAAETTPVIPLSVTHVGVILDGEDGEDWERLDNFGKTVFQTRKEAEMARKKREETDNEAD